MFVSEPRVSGGKMALNITAVTYKFTNRTPHMKLTRAAFRWLQSQISSKANLPSDA